MEQIKILYSDKYDAKELKDLEIFCAEAGLEKEHEASANMDAKNWQNNKASLLYLLLIEKRFITGHGGLYCLYKNEEIIAVSGYYRSDFHAEIFLFGVRSWVLKKYRLNLIIAEKFLPHHLKDIKNLKGQIAIISFNETTKSFAHLIARANRSSQASSKFFFGDRYPGIYRDMIFYPQPVCIKNSKQWILIKKLDQMDFDWSKIVWKED